MSFGFPMVVSCIDGTHITIRQPNKNAHDNLCYKIRYYMNTQTVCDQNGRFLHIDCSWSSNVHDDKFLETAL